MPVGCHFWDSGHFNNGLGFDEAQEKLLSNSIMNVRIRSSHNAHKALAAGTGECEVMAFTVIRARWPNSSPMVIQVTQTT